MGHGNIIESLRRLDEKKFPAESMIYQGATTSTFLHQQEDSGCNMFSTSILSLRPTKRQRSDDFEHGGVNESLECFGKKFLPVASKLSDSMCGPWRRRRRIS